MDTSAFASSTFSPVTWVNRVLAEGEALADPLAVHLAVVTSQLEMAYSTLSVRTDEAAARALAAVPRALRELESLRKSATALAAVTAAATAELDELEAQTGPAVAELGTLDGARERLVASAHALSQVQSLSSSLAEMNTLFKAGNYVEIAHKLEAMNSALELLAYMPSSDDVRTQVADYATQLESLVAPKLTSALKASDAKAVVSLVAVLRSISRSDEMWQFYLRARASSLNAAWGEVPRESGGDVGSWMASFMAEFVEWVAGELAFAGAVFSEDASIAPPRVLPHLVQFALDERQPPLGEVVGGVVASRDLVQGYALYSSVMTGLALTLEPLAEKGGLVSAGERLDSDPERPRPALGPVVESFVQPLAPFLDALVPLTVELLESSMAGVIQRHIPSSQAGSDPRPGSFTFELDASLDGSAASSLYAGVMQEVALAGGALFDELTALVEAELVEVHVSLVGEPVVAVLSETLNSFVGKMLQLLELLRSISPLDKGKTGSDGSDGRSAGLVWEFFQASIRGLESVAALMERLESFDEEVRRVLGRALQRVVTPERLAWWSSVEEAQNRIAQDGPTLVALDELEAAYGGYASLVPPPGSASEPGREQAQLAQFVVLAVTEGGTQLERVDHLRRALGEPGADRPMTMLPNPARAFAGLASEVVGLAKAFAFAPIAEQLAGVAGDEAWRAGGVPQPAFSMTPSAYITHVGDHLYMLLQQLEPFAGSQRLQSRAMQLLAPLVPGGGNGEGEGDAGGEGGDVFAALWVSAMARTAMSAFVDAILEVPVVTPAGARQLEADIGYLANVVAVLGEPLDPALSDVRTLLRGEDDSVGLVSGRASEIGRVLGKAREGGA
ncbi:uncharacterized protein AMSG_01357 [Thecamonas trahens ATCC 50062]|uniref:Conserved oligomeric Golgi complex subunit 7 n=1 Tax=Thecamonas trahens ATCC 50062 TaxID=461836 RepID=A0A0L0DQG2_THETB|nr:hypothetical protein AMSG_01357 [Thecamonas trahens ATCC 50062]KNC53648.1 hypothetical protein AMSG_01357 [Thecamonas trahens ATCC 50062]|eukprot:XP_013761963.1 hypothetical protein AMSG_01357 [Thecamonas trahens ATCC 50062]